MDKIIQSPGKYIQGRGVTERIGSYVSDLANKWLVISDAFVLGLVGDSLRKSFEDAKSDFAIEPFNGECCQTEIKRLVARLEEEGCQGIVGIGGGKTHDTAKAVAYYAKVPVAIVPTIASTDAPCSALSVIYTEKGEFESYLVLPSNPNLVLVDTKIVAEAPVRLLAAGVGDAAATYFEARACYRSRATNMAGGESTEAAFALAKLCYETLLDEGEKAIYAVERKVTTEAVERIIEANTYLSGVGFESGGLAAAHAIHNGLTMIDDTHHYYHGEKVAFGTLVQLILENAPREELNTYCKLCSQMKLPFTLAHLGIIENIESKAMIVAKAATQDGETIHNMPFKVTAELVYSAILAADQYGRKHINNY